MTARISPDLFLIPDSVETRGHGTIGMARFWKTQPQEFMQANERHSP